jgi:hypothetical protein
MQRMQGGAADTAGHLVVAMLDRITDTAGTIVLDVPVGWFRGGTAEVAPVAPLIASTPVWTLTTEGDVVWSPGDRLVVERRTRDGEVIWRLEGPVNAPVTPALLDARERELRTDPLRFPLTDVDFAAMRTRSDSLLPGVTGLTTTPDGRVVVARGIPALGNEVDYLRLAADGTPEARFRLDSRVRVLLAEGDSLLVHTPTDGEPWEVRWMRLK